MIKDPAGLNGIRTALLLLLLLSLSLYLPSLGHNAFADDEIYLAFSNRFLRESGWTELYRLFLGATNPWEFLPARDFSYWLDFRIFGDEPSGFHLTNLLWYAASCATSGFMFRAAIIFCRPAWQPHAGVLALVGAVLFAVHPAHVEAVVWIASRKDLMSGTFGALALWAVFSAFYRGVRRERIAAALLFFLLACLSKATSVALVLLIGAVLVAARPGLDKDERQIIVRYGAAFLAVGAFSLAVHVLVAAATGISMVNAPGIWEFLERASRILTSLCLVVVWPHPLRLYHDVYALGGWHWIVSAALVLTVLVGGLAFVLYRRLWGFSVLLIVLPLLPYLQLAPFTTWSLASERFAYLSVAGVAMLFAEACGRSCRARSVLCAMVLVVACSASIVWPRVGEWEYGHRLLELEYERQPAFHNAIRDRIVATLLPLERYEEAVDLARQVERDYARRALLSFIATERIFREADRRYPGGLRAADSAARQDFCDAVSHLTAAINSGRARTAHEPDVSYNNILRTLERYRDLRYGDAKWMCAPIERQAATTPS